MPYSCGESLMSALPSFYKTESYYQEIIRSHIRERMKRSDWEVFEKNHYFMKELHEQGYELSDHEVKSLSLWLEHLIALKFIREIIESTEAIEEVIIHNASWIQVIAKNRKEFFGPFLSEEDFELALEVFSFKQRLLWNRSSPFLSFQVHLFGQSWRAALMHESLSKGSKLFLRSQRKTLFPLESYRVTGGQAHLIKECITHKKNIIVSGATGSGKTSFLKTLTQFIPEREHLITLEDTSELTPQSPFATELIASPELGKSLNDYCHYALRMRPDRMILGEIRSHEVVPFLLSINTGHGGMMASLHANSAIDAIHRLCLLFQIYSKQTSVNYPDVLKLVCQGVDYIFHLENKCITNILEIKGCEGTTPYYELWN